jgi:TonB family protein
MLHILLESAPRTTRPNQATVFSVIMHLALIVVFVRGPKPSQPDPDSVTMEEVSYLIPFDRVKGPPPLEVRTHWRGMGRVGDGIGFDARPREEGVPTGPPESGRKTVANATVSAPQDIIYDTVATAVDVDSIARVIESAAPVYPPALLERSIEGRTVVQFVVDTMGRAEIVSFAVLETTHAEFAEAVRAVLPEMRFTPAIVSSHKVRQLVQQPFVFKIVPPTQTAARRDSVS